MKTFEEFWPFYVGEHRVRANRALHFIGSTLAGSIFLFAIFTGRWALVPLALVAGYGFAWVGHFIVEKNRPATFTHPLWSFAGDWKMWWLIATFRMEGEVRRLVPAAQPARAA
jgi:hypothetical protein